MRVTAETVDKFGPWPALLSEAKHIREEIWLEWQDLLNDNSVTEPKIHAFLKENAGFFLLDDTQNRLAISKLKIGRFETDFVLGYEEGSQGFKYNLIELESPTDEAYKSPGSPSKELNRALQQVRDWQQTIENDVALIEKLLPFTGGRKHGPSRFRYTVVIGTRVKNERWQDKIVQLARTQTDKVSIRSFDWFSDVFLGNRYPVFPLYFSSELESLDPLLRNALANPFFEALTDASWAQIVSDGRFSAGRTIAKTVSLFLEQHKLSRHSDRFHSFVDGLPENQRTAIKNVVAQQIEGFR
jgi:Domain of unknown function (DUF4263)